MALDASSKQCLILGLRHLEQAQIEATFKKGVLKVTLPKSAEAQKAEKKIPVKAA